MMAASMKSPSRLRNIKKLMGKNLNECVGVLVDIGRGFVDNEDAVVPQQRSSQAYQLALTNRHVRPTFGELKVQTAWKSIDCLKGL